MIFIQLSAFILLVMGIVWALELTPERINKDLSGFFEKRESLQDMSRVARGKKKQNKIVKELSRIRRILTETGKEKNFSVALTLSLILMVVGCVMAILMDNIFLAPVLAILFAMMPFMYLMRSVGSYNKHVREDLEMSLSLVTTAYIDCDNLKMAIGQYVNDMRPSMQGVFREFLGEVETISPNMEEAIYHMAKAVKQVEPMRKRKEKRLPRMKVRILPYPNRLRRNMRKVWLKSFFPKSRSKRRRVLTQTPRRLGRTT